MRMVLLVPDEMAICAEGPVESVTSVVPQRKLLLPARAMTCGWLQEAGHRQISY